MRRRVPRREQKSTSVDLQGRRLEYLLKRSSARRTLALRVSERGEVVVNAPLVLPQSGIEAFLRRHADWVWQRLALVPARQVWRPGMSLPYLGAALSLDWSGDAPAGARQEVARLLVGGSWERVGEVVLDWYRHQAGPLLAARLSLHAARMGVALPPMRLSDARTRWGSLSPKGVVSLNWRLLKMPLEILDYVICHELAHLRQRNHSAAFWREVAGLCPDYLAAREHLRRQGRQYFDF